MKEDMFVFDTLVDECLQNIRIHVFDGAGMQASPAIFRFLSAWPNEEILAQIVDATSYVACRPTRLKPPPQAWCLNQIGSLRLDGLATYYKGFDTVNQEEAVILLQKRTIASKTTSFTAAVADRID